MEEKFNMQKKILTMILVILMLFCLSACVSNENTETSNTSVVDQEILNDEESDEKVTEPQISEAEVGYLEQEEELYPYTVCRAVQNYIVSANDAMYNGVFPSSLYILEDEFRYYSMDEAGWGYYAEYFEGCEVLPVDYNMVYSFQPENYILDYVINDDFDKNMETFSGKVYFQLKIVENSEELHARIKQLPVTETVCISFKAKYSANDGDYRLVEMEYLSSENECSVSE